MNMLKNFKSIIFMLLIAALVIIACATKKENSVTVKTNSIITDTLDSAENYYNIHPDFAQAFAFLKDSSVAALEPGKYPIGDGRVYCIISNSPGKQMAEAKLEAHRKYIDIQYVISGMDSMGLKPVADCQTVATPYDSTKDIEFFADKPDNWLPVNGGSFAIFYPKDAHAPMVSAGMVHKVVVKVPVE